jgi:hypothetical protein
MPSPATPVAGRPRRTVSAVPIVRPVSAVLTYRRTKWTRESTTSTARTACLAGAARSPRSPLIIACGTFATVADSVREAARSPDSTAGRRSRPTSTSQATARRRIDAGSATRPAGGAVAVGELAIGTGRARIAGFTRARDRPSRIRLCNGPWFMGSSGSSRQFRAARNVDSTPVSPGEYRRRLAPDEPTGRVLRTILASWH